MNKLKRIALLLIICSCVFLKPASGELLYYSLKTDSLEKIYSDKHYSEDQIMMNKTDFENLKQESSGTYSILQRIRNLEGFYEQIKSAMDSLSGVIKVITTILNIPNTLTEKPVNNEFKHISGVVMSPGYVEFRIRTTDTTKTFDDLNLDSLEIDIYYNKELFTIDHIAGKKIVGDEFKEVALSTKDSNAKDRIELPLSDVLSNEVKFQVYLAPLDPETVQVGDKTKMTIKYFKRVPQGTQQPLIYEIMPGSPDTIEVVVV